MGLFLLLLLLLLFFVCACVCFFVVVFSLEDGIQTGSCTASYKHMEITVPITAYGALMGTKGLISPAHNYSFAQEH